MTPKEKLNSLLNEKYISEDGDEYQIEILEGLTNDEIENLKEQLPNNYIPNEIEELLKFTSGFEFYGFEEIKFDSINQFGFEEFFPNSIKLAGDGFGNFWILYIDENGNWGNVFYVCHDPAVVVKHSENLSEFIGHVNEFGKNGRNSNLDEIHEKSVFDIWQNKNGFITIQEAKNLDILLKEFAETLSESYVIVDLRNKPNKYGFAWGKFGPKIDNVKRHKTEMIWAIEQPEKKKGFFAKLLGK